MTQSTFANFRYKVNKAPFNKTRTVTVSFDYDGHPVKRVLVFRERKDADYVGSAQKQIKKEFRNGELEKYCEQYMKKGGGSASAKPALIVVLSVVAAAALALTGLTIYKTFFASNGGGGDPTATYYQVDFDSDGGTSIPSQQIKEGQKATEPKKPTKEGYEFDNWYPSESSTEPFKFDTTITANVTLYARWTTNTFNVTFKTNGGTWNTSGGTADKKVNVKYGAMPDPGDTLSKLGSTFTGWSPALSPVSDKSPKEYTAQWASVATYFTVSFDSDGGTSMPAQKIELGHLATNPGKPDKTGYYFDGWFQDQGGQTPWAFDSKIVTSDVTIYAHWTINKFSVDFNPNGGKWSDESIATKTVSDVEYNTMPNPGEEPTKVGYTFAGWSPAIKPVIAPGEAYTAKWVASDYFTVSFNTQGGSSVEAKQVLAGEKVTKPANPSWAGHHFDGWFKEASGTAEWDFENDSVNDNVTIYAHWTINKFDISFVPKGGKWSDGSTATKIVHDVEYGSMPKPGDTLTRTGYTFTGWSPTLELVTDTATYEAQWVESSYFTVTFDTQGGSSIDAQKVLEGNPATRPTENPTKTGSTFSEWHKTRDGVDDVWDFSTPITKNVTIYAHWTIETFNIAFDATEGATWPSGATQIKTIKNVEYGTMPDPGETPEKAGYTFKGWSSALAPVTEATTYTAQWEIQTKSISIDPNGLPFTDGSTDVKLINVEYGKTWQEVKENNPTIKIKEPLPTGIKTYTYNYLDQGVWKEIQDTDTITNNLAFKVIYVPVDPSDFSNDSWETFTAYINSNSFTGMTTEGAHYYEAYHENGDTFVGLTRTITIDTALYTVRVIGENTSAGQSDAKFTFEFEQVLDLEVPYSLDSENNSYKDSYINKNLAQIFQYELPSIIRENIKPTTISYYDTHEGEEKLNMLETKLFVLSTKELGLSKFPDGFDTPSEGAAYQYYDGKTADALKKTKIDGTPVNYWTRTPDITGNLETAWNINASGTLGENDAAIATNSGGVYIAPAFRL